MKEIKKKELSNVMEPQRSKREQIKVANLEEKLLSSGEVSNKL
jgi:hypothetical protein